MAGFYRLYICVVADATQLFVVTRIAICQTIRHRRKSHSLLTFDVGIPEAHLRVVKLPSTWISTRSLPSFDGL